MVGWFNRPLHRFALPNGEPNQLILMCPFLPPHLRHQAMRVPKINALRPSGESCNGSRAEEEPEPYQCDQQRIGEQWRKTTLRDDLGPPGVRIFDNKTVLNELGRIGSH